MTRWLASTWLDEAAPMRRRASFYEAEDATDAPPQHHEARAMTALWHAVLLQQVQDAKTRSQHPEKQRMKQRALEYLFSNSEDFCMVCEMAGLNASWVRRKLVQAAGRNFAYEGEQVQAVRPAQFWEYKTRLRRKLSSLGLFPDLQRVQLCPKRRRRPLSGHRQHSSAQRGWQLELL